MATRGRVNYKGISRGYDVGSSREYDAWLSDDGATGSFEEEMNSFGAVDKRKKAAMDSAKKESKRRQKNKAQRDANTAGVAANKKALGNKAANAPKPKGDQQIEPVKESAEISAARQVVNSYQSGLKDQKSPWEQAQADANSSSFGSQNQTDFTSQFNPSGSDDTPQMSQETTDMKNRAQDFADKYKLDLISSGATKNQFNS